MDEAALVMAMTPRPAIQVAGFQKRYRQHTAVHGLDLEIQTGELYGLIGPDGAGKSSLLKALAGVMTYDAGKVEVLGVHIDSETAAERVKPSIGFMPQGLGLNLYGELSVEENIDFFARLRLVSDQALAERKQRLLAMTRLERFRERPTKLLSGGMKQKLGLVCTLIHEPDLLILDEPTTGVDPVSRRDFWAILVHLLEQRGITALVTTAYMDEASRFQRIALMYDGRLLAQGEPSEVVARAPGSVVVLRTARQTETFARLGTRFSQLVPQGDSLRIFVDGADPDSARQHVLDALDGLPVDALDASPATLDDTFVAMLRRERAAPEHDNVQAAGRFERGSGNIDPDKRAAAHIEARNLTRDFGNFRAVDGVNLTVREGQIYGLLGPNGSGKTTVIKMLTGILPPSAGSARVAQADVRRADREVKQRIGYMSQAFSLYTELTVRENIEFYAGIYGLGLTQGRERCRWIVRMADLARSLDTRTRDLPVGMRQRLALGCALIHEPQVLFLDEPTSGVDPIGRQQFWDILFTLTRHHGVAVLVTTHYMSEAEHCDQVGLMYAGQLVADASPQALKRELESQAGGVLEVTTAQPLAAIAELDRAGFVEPTLYGNRIHVLSRHPVRDQQVIPGVLRDAGMNALAVTPQALSMEDVFVHRIRALEQGESTARGGA